MAIVHLVGAFIASFAFLALTLTISAWELKAVQKRRLQGVAIALGVPVATLEKDEELVPSLIEYSSRRYSGELLRNRVSDLFGLLRAVWGWLAIFVQVGIVGFVSWLMYAQGAFNSVFMWITLANSVFFWGTSVVFTFTCVLLTGRYPGEAKSSRKAITLIIEQRGAWGHVRSHQRERFS
jgi:hypothetical protein